MEYTTVALQQLDQVQAFIKNYRRELDLAWTIALFGIPLYLKLRQHQRKASRFPTYGSSGAPYIFLFLHVFFCTTELARWHYLRLTQHTEPVASKLDVSLALISIATSFIIVPRNKKVKLTFYRMGFLLTGFLRLIAMTLAYAKQDTHWQRASIKLLHVFATSGWLISFLVKQRIMEGGFLSAAAAGLSLTLSVILYDSEYSHGCPISIALLFSLVEMDAVIVRNIKIEHLEKSFFLRSIAFFGLIDKYAIARRGEEASTSKTNSNSNRKSTLGSETIKDK